MEIAILLDRQQVDRLKNIALDQDEKYTTIFLTEILKKVKSSNMGCNPLEFRTQRGISEVIRESGKKREAVSQNNEIT